MTRIACRLAATTTLLVVILATATVASAQAPTANNSAADDPDEAASLVVTGDFNQDGIADIAKITSNAENSSEPGSLTVLLGQTNGVFKEMPSKPVPGRIPRTMVVGDFNKDGIPDLIVGAEDGTLSLFLGDGTGNFSSISEIAHLDSAMSIAVADFNKDGILDVAVSDWRASSITVLLGAGNGTFRNMWSFPLRMRGTSPHIAAADFNGDGVPDLAVVYEGDDADTFDVMLGNGNGTFTIAPDRGFVRNPNSHCNT